MTTRPREDGPAVQEARNVRLCLAAQDDVVEVAAPAQAPAAAPQPAPEPVPEPAPEPAPEAAPEAAPDAAPTEPESDKLAVPVPNDVLHSFLARQYYGRFAQENGHNDRLRSWMCITIAKWLKCGPNQNLLRTAALSGAAGMIVRFRMRAILKHKLTNRRTCCPTQMHVKDMFPELGSLVHIVQAPPPSVAPDAYVQKFPFCTPQGEQDATETKDTLYVVLLWASARFHNMSDFYLKCSMITTEFDDEPEFRLHCKLPPVTTRLEDCPLEEV